MIDATVADIIERARRPVQINTEVLGNQFAADRVSFVVPSEQLSMRQLSNLIRIFEILVAFRGMTIKGNVSSAWHAKYRDYLNSIYSRVAGMSSSDVADRLAMEGLASNYGVRSSVYEIWLSAHVTGDHLFRIEKVEVGSYDFVLYVANLAAIFGLQEYGLIKDILQWVAAALGKLLEKQGESEVGSGKQARLRLSPELVRSLREFDDVSLTEERTTGGTKLSVRLRKFPTQLNRPDAPQLRSPD